MKIIEMAKWQNLKSKLANPDFPLALALVIILFGLMMAVIVALVAIADAIGYQATLGTLFVLAVVYVLGRCVGYLCK